MFFVLATVLTALWGSGDRVQVVDLELFAEAGGSLFTARWADVFRDEIIQVGPVNLLIQGLIWWVSTLTNLSLQFVFGVVVQPLTMVATILSIRVPSTSPERHSARVELLFAALLLAWQVPWLAYGLGHPSEYFIPLLWFSSARSIARNRPGIAAFWFAIAVGLKGWGLLGLPLLLYGGNWRRSLLATGLAAGWIAFMYLPFFIFGEVRTFGFQWEVMPGSGADRFFEEGGIFGWPARLGQGTLAVGVGAWLYKMSGRSLTEAWIPALGVVAVRLLLDPLIWPHYWLAASAITIVGAGWAANHGRGLLTLGLVGVAAVTFMMPPLPLWLGHLTLIVAALGGAVVARRTDAGRIARRRSDS